MSKPRHPRKGVSKGRAAAPTSAPIPRIRSVEQLDLRVVLPREADPAVVWDSLAEMRQEIGGYRRYLASPLHRGRRDLRERLHRQGNQLMVEATRRRLQVVEAEFLQKLCRYAADHGDTSDAAVMRIAAAAQLIRDRAPPPFREKHFILAGACLRQHLDPSYQALRTRFLELFENNLGQLWKLPFHQRGALTTGAWNALNFLAKTSPDERLLLLAQRREDFIHMLPAALDGPLEPDARTRARTERWREEADRIEERAAALEQAVRQLDEKTRRTLDRLSPEKPSQPVRAWEGCLFPLLLYRPVVAPLILEVMGVTPPGGAADPKADELRNLLLYCVEYWFFVINNAVREAGWQPDEPVDEPLRAFFRLWVSRPASLGRELPADPRCGRLRELLHGPGKAFHDWHPEPAERLCREALETAATPVELATHLAHHLRRRLPDAERGEDAQAWNTYSAKHVSKALDQFFIWHWAYCDKVVVPFAAAILEQLLPGPPAVAVRTAEDLALESLLAEEEQALAEQRRWVHAGREEARRRATQATSSALGRQAPPRPAAQALRFHYVLNWGSPEPRHKLLQTDEAHLAADLEAFARRESVGCTIPWESIAHAILFYLDLPPEIERLMTREKVGERWFAKLKRDNMRLYLRPTEDDAHELHLLLRKDWVHSKALLERYA